MKILIENEIHLEGMYAEDTDLLESVHVYYKVTPEGVVVILEQKVDLDEPTMNDTLLQVLYDYADGPVQLYMYDVGRYKLKIIKRARWV
jgi:hypothetical protein